MTLGEIYGHSRVNGEIRAILVRARVLRSDILSVLEHPSVRCLHVVAEIRSRDVQLFDIPRRPFLLPRLGSKLLNTSHMFFQGSNNDVFFWAIVDIV